MEVFLTVLHICLCFFLLLVVLLQPGKGADFGAAMGGASQESFGAAGAVSIMAKLTTVVAALFMGTSLGLAWFSNAPERSFIGGDELEQELQELRGKDGDAADPGAAAPAPAPVEDVAPATDEPAGDVAPATDGAAPEDDEAAPGDDQAAPDGGEAPEDEAPSDEENEDSGEE